jgi:hypothetical protein
VIGITSHSWQRMTPIGSYQAVIAIVSAQRKKSAPIEKGVEPHRSEKLAPVGGRHAIVRLVEDRRKKTARSDPRFGGRPNPTGNPAAELWRWLECLPTSPRGDY